MIDKLRTDISDEDIKAAIASVHSTNSVDYKFGEDHYLKVIQSYIDSTYSQHYSKGKLQATEFIIDMGDGLGFCRGNVVKYAKRYGQKAGRNKDDLLKVIHYAIMLLHVHDLETE